MSAGVFNGVISRIGVGTITAGTLTTASVFEIGNNALRDISYDNYISTYLTVALEAGAPAAVHIIDTSIIASRFLVVPKNLIAVLKTGGKIYYSNGYDEIVKRSKLRASNWVFIVGLGLFTYGIGGILSYLFLKYKVNQIDTVLRDGMAEIERANV